jgi:hypothetical protein
MDIIAVVLNRVGMVSELILRFGLDMGCLLLRDVLGSSLEEPFK